MEGVTRCDSEKPHNCGLILLKPDSNQPYTFLLQLSKRFFSEERKKQIAIFFFFFLLRLALASKFLAFTNQIALHQLHLCHFGLPAHAES